MLPITTVQRAVRCQLPSMHLCVASSTNDPTLLVVIYVSLGLCCWPCSSHVFARWFYSYWPFCLLFSFLRPLATFTCLCTQWPLSKVIFVHIPIGVLFDLLSNALFLVSSFGSCPIIYVFSNKGLIRIKRFMLHLLSCLAILILCFIFFVRIQATLRPERVLECIIWKQNLSCKHSCKLILTQNINGTPWYLACRVRVHFAPRPLTFGVMLCRAAKLAVDLPPHLYKLLFLAKVPLSHRVQLYPSIYFQYRTLLWSLDWIRLLLFCG